MKNAEENEQFVYWTIRQGESKSFPCHKALEAMLISVSLVLTQTPAYTARLRVSRGVPLFSPALAGTVLIAPTHEGMARLS